jgi:S-adenosylmethionine/arginine decarboxylase-like enzyme
LIKDIGMQVMAGPEVRYVTKEGNEGLTAVAIIETSHVALHVWDKQDPPLLQLDVYTCGPFKPGIVLKYIQEFRPTKIQWKYLDRETDLQTVDIGIWTEGSPWPDNRSMRGENDTD